MQTDLRYLASLNLRAILTLTESPLPAPELTQAGVHALHLPVNDFTAPNPQQLLEAMDFIDRNQASGFGVYVHCLMGMGRTGTVLAAYLTRAGYTPEVAIQRIRELRPGSLVSPEQERAVEAFSRRRDWIV